MDWIRAVEIFAMLTGVAYVILEILQKNAMWVVGIFTGLACACSFAVQHIWASMALNIYYVAMSVVGLVQWRRDAAAVAPDAVHLHVLSRRTALWSAGLFVLLSLGLIWLLRWLGDGAPVLDAMASVLSVIATWWLAKSYIQQWLLWIVANLMTTALCLSTGQWMMSLLYLAYTASAVYGYIHWKRRGIVVNLPL